MFPIFAGSNPSGYNLTRSLRFRASASAYLNRTLSSSPTNVKIWTWSGWVKRGGFGAMGLFAAGNGTTDGSGLVFDSSNRLNIYDYVSSTFVAILTSSQVFRDPSAWYHIVCAYDVTQATASNRLKLYVNGVQITAFATATYPALNTSGYLNYGIYATSIAREDGFGNYFDGYLAEVNFIDGQALTPSSFGSTSSTTGVWQPAKYSGSYGTNGFYLPFTDNSALTTSSNAGLGKDFSGNGNYWTTNNISITAGVTYDSMTDVPTLTSATAANFAVLNPLQASAPALVDGNLNTPSLSAQTVYGTISAKSGKWYWEGKCTARATGVTYVGVENNTYFLSNQAWTTSVFAMQSNSQKYLAGTVTSYGSGFAAGDTIGVALDVTNDTLEFFVNGTSQGQITSVGMAQNNMRPMFQGNTATWQVNFGQRPFAYTPPTGFVALNTYNLPTSTIVKGNTVMDATLYTGTLLSNSVVNAAAFKPDLVWLKSRSAATNNELTDSVRGVTKALVSNSTAAEATDVQGLTAFNTNGFTVGTNTDYNNLAATYVAWQWQAGQGSSSSNTSGSITSSVSVNASAGFSVVTYTGISAAGTVGHGLGVAPSFIVVKDRSRAGFNWSCYHSSLGATYAILLNSTNAAASGSTDWNSTAPTSSVFSIPTGGGSYNTNYNGDSFVAYCWTPIAGYSAFGSYTGNGSADGTFVYTGFRPKFVMIKRTDAGGYSWCMYDTARDPYNAEITLLRADSSSGDVSPYALDGLSNGFKLRQAYDATNASGGTFIYMAFAENPLKFALAR